MYFLYGYPKYFNRSSSSKNINKCDLYLDEYFHFCSIAGQKFEMKEILFKKLNNCMP